MGFWGPSAGQQSPAGLGCRTAPWPAPSDHSGQGPDFSARPPRCWPGLFAWPAQTQESCSRSLNTLSVSEVQSSPSPLAASPRPQVQLQLLTAIVKLFLKKPTETQELVQQVLSLATQVGAASLRCPAGPGSTPPPREPDRESSP